MIGFQLQTTDQERTTLLKLLFFKNVQHFIIDFIDLQLCYDWQLVNIGSIVEELVLRNRSAMKLFIKLMQNSGDTWAQDVESVAIIVEERKRNSKEQDKEKIL